MIDQDILVVFLLVVLVIFVWRLYRELTEGLRLIE